MLMYMLPPRLPPFPSSFSLDTSPIIAETTTVPSHPIGKGIEAARLSAFLASSMPSALENALRNSFETLDVAI